MRLAHVTRWLTQARQRWRFKTGSALTCAQISLGVRSLYDHATSFGVVSSKHSSRPAAENRCVVVWDAM